jgi:lipoprotein Spr
MKQIFLLLFLLISYINVNSQDFIYKNRYAGDSLFDFIHTWWGTKYRYGGTTKKGIDCSAFTLKLFNDVYDVSLPRTASEQYKATKRIPKEALKDGDLVFFRTRYKSTWHVGVYLTDGWFVHSKSRVGVAIDNLGNPLYNRIYFGAGRYTQLSKL